MFLPCGTTTAKGRPSREALSRRYSDQAEETLHPICLEDVEEVLLATTQGPAMMTDKEMTQGKGEYPGMSVREPPENEEDREDLEGLEGQEDQEDQVGLA